MTVFLNGKLVPESEARVSVFDRSFLYGDGLFETIRVSNAKPFRWGQHLDRLQRGADFLGIEVPFSQKTLTGHAAELIARNGMAEALLRLTLSRGVGVRSYSPKGADRPTLAMTLHPLGAPTSAPAEPETPIRWRAHAARVRLPAGDALAQFKTCNKLAQIMARAEAESAGADEAVLLNTDGFVVEAASGNLFWIRNSVVHTPPLTDGILQGITRAVVFELCGQLRLRVQESRLRPGRLLGTDGVFVSLSSLGIVELSEIDGTALRRSPIVGQLFNAYRQLLQAECR
jgi:branched-chain amino acid aminotransferase